MPNYSWTTCLALTLVGCGSEPAEIARPDLADPVPDNGAPAPRLGASGPAAIAAPARGEGLSAPPSGRDELNGGSGAWLALGGGASVSLGISGGGGSAGVQASLQPAQQGGSSGDRSGGGGSSASGRTSPLPVVRGQPPRELPIGVNGYLNLAPPRGEPFERAAGAPLVPEPPLGWDWYPVAGTSCRDGSEAGLFIRFAESKRLLIVFEGGGACTNKGFCDFNPQSLNEVLFGTGETVLGTVLGAVPGRQQPGVYSNNELKGMFAVERSENSFKDWSVAYIPYCTGDVHFGTRQAATVPGVAEPQKFVGAFNTERIVGRLLPTFEAGLERVVVTGMSAGSFGAALNFSMISDAFAGVQTDAILDSGIPFDDEYWPPCQQKSWRQTFGLDAALPPDCEECFREDGGGLLGLTDFLQAKHPTSHIALVSSMQDEVIRLFFTPGENQCATLADADPVGITLGQLAGAQLFGAEKYSSGLLGVRSRFQASGRMATYFIAEDSAVLHQHLMRDRFFEPVAGGQSIADFVSEFLSGKISQVGP